MTVYSHHGGINRSPLGGGGIGIRTPATSITLDRSHHGDHTGDIEHSHHGGFNSSQYGDMGMPPSDIG
jgi:hypothetical protein